TLGGSALRIQNFTDIPPIIPPLPHPLQHPEPVTYINIVIKQTSFKDIQLSWDISNRGCAAVQVEIGDNGSLIIDDESFTSCSYIENDGGDTLEVVGGRGGALYIYLAEESTFNFKIGEDSSFITNDADICGEDIFINSRIMNILNIRTHILFDITTFTNSDNAMYETEYKFIDELYHIPLIDYNLLERYIYYSNDTMYVSIRKWGGVDTEECGDVNSTCNSFEHAVLKQTTPDRTPTNLQYGQQIVYTYISVVTTDEISVAADGGSVYFDEKGEMEFSDQAYWQIKKIGGVDYSSIKGVNQKVLFHSINIVLPTTKQAKYVLKLVGAKDYIDIGRNLDLMIAHCSFTQNNTLNQATNFSLLRTEPFLSLRMNVSIFNFKGYNASIEGTGLIEMNYEPDVFTWDNHLNLVNCSFTNISSIMTAKELKEIIGEKDDEQPLGIASILNIRSGSAKILPIYIYDCQFDQCKCSVEIPTKERRQIGVGGAIAFSGKTLLLTLEHLKLMNCSGNVTFAQPKSQYSINRQINHDENELNLLNKKKMVSNVIKKAKYQIEVAGGTYVSLVCGGRGEERFIAKKSLSEYVRKQEMKKLNASKLIRVTESGGAFVHIDRSAAKCNFQSSIFTDCGITTTPWTPVIFSTNIAPCIGQKSEDEIFEPLWDRELRNGKMGTGLVVAREETSPLIKANEIQFINCDEITQNIQDPIISTQILFIPVWGQKSKVDRDEKYLKIVNQEIPQITVKIKPHFKQLAILPSIEDLSNLFIINIKELNSEIHQMKQFILHLSESERKLVESEERLRIAESSKGEEERKQIQAELGKRDAEDKAGIAEQRMKDAEEQIVIIESIKNNAEQEQMKIDFHAEEKDEDENEKEIRQMNIIICQKIIAYYIGNKNNNDGRKQAIEAGTVDALLRLLCTQPLERISLSHIYAFFIFTNSSSDEIGEMLYNRNPYISLIHLFDHQDFFIINRAAISMFNLLNNGSRTRLSTATYPHYQYMIACYKIQKLFRLIKQYSNKDIKISTSLFIGLLFIAKRIRDQSMKRKILSYLKMFMNEEEYKVKKFWKMHID
ncbi:MAG: hypothetical protein EZS28_021858, partial [Streblomastix strix]